MARSRDREPDTDDEPEEWQTALPMRSPLPLLFTLIGIQVAVAALLVLYAVSGGDQSKANPAQYRSR